MPSSRKGNPMGALWWGQARDLHDKGKTQADIVDILGVGLPALRKAFAKMGVKGYARRGGRGKPVWHAMAQDLLDEGVPPSVVARRCGISKTTITAFIDQVYSKEQPAAERPAKASGPRPKKGKQKLPVAGELDPNVMDPVRAFARGDITRAEMMERLGKKRPTSSRFAPPIE